MALIKQKQVDGLVADLASKLNLTGGTLTGDLILDADPTTALGAATKQYVDAAVTSQVTYKGAFDPTASAGAGSPDLDTITSVTGDMYTVTVAGTYTWTTGSAVLEVGDVLIAESAGVLNDVADWTIVNKNLDAASIKTSYESNADTNEFSDAEQTKLANIETAADVTDTANVTSAGALMDSEVANLADVKAFDTTDYATAAQGSTADSASQATGVENNADVTDTANVTSAGALMDSEITNLADVKAFDPADYAPAGSISATVTEEDDACPVTSASTNFNITLGTAPTGGIAGVVAVHINGVGVSAAELISVTTTTMVLNVPYAVDATDVVATRYF